ncbi:MAG: Gfo/Idh/MocA family oxidoreductase [Chloroflexi bacterium]|nr:Gfo/Idh/MocA family oxidoreductase [Chloroflexota bacterium]
MKEINVGIIGCGFIAREKYVSGIRKFDFLKLIACADIRADAARQMSEDLGIPRACSVEELLADESIELVLNLTTPQAHTPINHQILDANKHFYVEKPFALTRDDAQAILEKAETKKLLTSSAPDTFLGAGIQTCRKVIDDGWIGMPTAATAFMAVPGHELWHPDPEFYYAEGGGPILDMGPYYLTALVNLLGPIKRVVGMSKATFPERVIASGPKRGNRVPVDIDTHISACLEFESGVIATMIMSFDVQAHSLPHLEIYGTEGTLSVPDPNIFQGPVRVFRPNQQEMGWQEMPMISPYHMESRGIGAADLALAIRGIRPHIATGELATHVLDAILSIEESAHKQEKIDLVTTVKRPAILPLVSRIGDIA